jgi:hypothetical protein
MLFEKYVMKGSNIHVQPPAPGNGLDACPEFCQIEDRYDDPGCGIAGSGSSGKHALPEAFEKGPGIDPDRACPIAALLDDEGRDIFRPDSVAHLSEILTLQIPGSGRIPLGRVQAETDDQVGGWK